MDTYRTTGQVSRELGVSVPRVLRAVREGVVPAGRRGNRTVLSDQSVESLRTRWGSVPRLDGLTREEVLVLVALSRRPLGLRSARAAALDAGISPTTASRALRRLQGLGYLEQTRQQVPGAASGTDETWRVRVGRPPWSHTAGRLAGARLPTPRGTPAPVTAVPARLLHLF